MDRYYANRYTFIFQGAGTEFRKHISTMDESRLNTLKRYCIRVKDVTGMHIWEYINDGLTTGEDEELFDQVSIYTINCSIYEMYRSMGYMPRFLLAYSMGIYSALYCGGALTFEEGLLFVIKAYGCMRHAMGSHKGAMASVIGLRKEEVEEIIAKLGAGAYMEVVNENNEYSTVVSGLKPFVEKFMERALQEGALKVIPVKTDIAYHSMFIADAAQDFSAFVESCKVVNLKYPMVACTNQEVITGREDIKKELCRNVKSAISWRKTIEKSILLGADRFLEVGLGASLSRISKIINGDCEFISYDQLVNKGGMKERTRAVN